MKGGVEAEGGPLGGLGGGVHISCTRGIWENVGLLVWGGNAGAVELEQQPIKAV